MADDNKKVQDPPNTSQNQQTSHNVIPQLWHSPYMAYYVSWMKFLKTISTTGNNNNKKSSKNTTLKKLKKKKKSTSDSSSSSQSRDVGSISSPSSQQNSGGNPNDTVVQDPYGRFEGSHARLIMSGGSTVRGFPSNSRIIEKESNGRGNKDQRQGDDGDVDNDEDEDEDEDDDDDGDMSGLLRLAESQRQNQVQVGWGGNCTSEREVSTHGFTFHAREIFSPTLSSSSSSSSSPTPPPRSNKSSCVDVDDSDDASGKTDKHGLNIKASNNNHTSSICRNEGDGNMITGATAAAATVSTTPSPQHQHQQTMLITPPTTTTPPTITLTTSFTLRPFEYGSLIRVLDFSHLYYIISDKFLTHLLPQTPLLLELVIHSPKQFSDESLICLSKSCSLLRRLELQGCVKISDLGLGFVLDACLNISTLVISHNGAADITDRTLSQLAMATFPLFTKHQYQHQHQHQQQSSQTRGDQGQMPQDLLQQQQRHSSRAQRLRVLGLSCPSYFITEGNPGLMSIAIWCTNLVSLDISNLTPLVTDELLRLVSKTSPEAEIMTGAGIEAAAAAPSSYPSCLKRLNIAHCSLVTNKGLFYLARGCPDLRQLDITGLHLVDDQGILEIAKRCRSFKKLIMDDKFGARIAREILKNFPSWGAEVLRQGMTFERRGSRTF
ncbi:hypothetical protein BGZ80_003360 [Entomortierella chlamydospora]|uniref:Uncharacterized protein n=1 Tax=Entomortierella chlamydospora TaxID=101097 RepID=A0A9P6MPK1_9FUNG|nr:hypothetical protein BGZ80_003360 [Entomortierella chlamydospora]